MDINLKPLTIKNEKEREESVKGSNKNILLIASYLGESKFTGEKVYPLGLSYLATATIKHNVYIFDPNIVEKPDIETENIIKKVNPDVIGLSLRNIGSCNSFNNVSFYEPFKLYLKFIKKKSPMSKIIVGGSGFSIFAKEIMEELNEINYGVFIEGEESLPELLDNLDTPQRVKGIYYRNNNKIIFTGVRKPVDFEKLPIPRREISDIKPYLKYPSSHVIGIQTKRGCPFKCSYCTYRFLTGSYIRMRSVKQVVDEIEQLVKLGVKSFHFADNMFNVPIKHAEDICDEISSIG